MPSFTSCTSPRVATVAVLVSLVFASSAWAESLSDFIRIQTFKTHSRVTIKVDSSVEVLPIQTAQEARRGFTILLKGLTLTDLGAPFGSDHEWVREVEAVAKSDSRVQKLNLQEREDGVTVTAQWKFPSGALALATPRMETFHYRKNDAAQYVIDFWPKPGPTLAAAKAAADRRAREAKLAAARAKMQGRRDRRIANEKLRAERDDNLRFCRENWDEKREIFLPFQPVEAVFDFSKYLPSGTADKGHEYLNPTGDAEEAQLFRLAVKLYGSEKYALVIKTLDFLDSRVSKPEIRVEAAFLRANSMLKLGYEEQGVELLKSVMNQSRSSKAAQRSAMFIALKRHEAKDPLASLEYFVWLTQYHTKSPVAWVFHLGAAEALAQLRQTQRSAAEFRWVMENASSAENQARGAIRMGDLFLERRQYDQALASYFLASQNFGKEVVKFPSFYLNRAEALYWLGQYDRAAEVYGDFLKRHQASGEGWRALYRLAELHGRKGELARADGYLTETVNRHPYSVGAILSRMRLLSCGTGLEPTTAKSTVSNFFENELTRFDPSAEVFVDRLADYRGLAHVRALLAAGDEESALNVALAQLNTFSSVDAGAGSTRDAVSRLMGHLYRKIILKKLGDQPTDESRLVALSFHHEMGPKMPRSSGAVEADYLLKLSQAAVDLGMPQWGQQLAQDYQLTVAIERKLASAQDDEIDQKLAISERSFAEARALWIAGDSDSKIVPLLKQVAEESPYSYEREILFSLVEHRAGRPASSLQHALKARMLAAPTERNQPRLLHWIARLNRESGNPKAATEAYAELRGSQDKDSGRLASLGVVPVPSKQSLMMIEVDLLTSLGRWGEAASLFSDSKSESGLTLDSPLKYQYAQVLRKTGKLENLKKSQEMLEALAKEAPEDFWKKMAHEALQPVKSTAKEGNP